MRLVLDTNFFFLHYFSTGERSAKTKAVLNKCRKIGNIGIIPAIVIGEAYAVIQRISGRSMAEKAYSEMINSKLQLIDMTPEIAKQAGILRIKSQESIPWGDCIIAATAIIYDADYVVSEDPHFKKLDGIKVRTLEELAL